MLTVLVQNEKDTLPTDVAVADLAHVIEIGEPDLGVLNEWNRIRDRKTRKMLRAKGYEYARPLRGGGPVFWKASKFKKRSVRSKVIAPGGFMGKLPGRRSWLGPSYLTVARLSDLEDGKPNGQQTVLDGFHMTAEVQDMKHGGGYKTDAAHARRVRRHKIEKANIEHYAGLQQDHGMRVFPAGDTNFAHMVLDGFRNCWTGNGPGGDLDGRPVTICFAAKPADQVVTVATHSDHLAVLVRYPDHW